MSKEPPKEDRIQVVAEHRRARFDYHIEDQVEAGLQLTGSEVKSLRNGQANLNDAYGIPNRAGELYLHHAHIAGNLSAAVFSHEPTRPRKLLMHREEIDRWGDFSHWRAWSSPPRTSTALSKSMPMRNTRSDSSTSK